MKIFSIALILFFSLKTLACDMCGNFMGITPYDNQSQFTCMHRYRVFNGYRSYQQRSAFFVPGAYKAAHNPAQQNDSVIEIKNHSVKDYETFKVVELRGKYFLHPRVEINFILPVQQIKTSYDGIKNTSTGLADPSLFLGYHLVKRLSGYKLRQRLIVGAGIKSPLGNYKAANAQHQRFFLLTQNGSGSWDSFYYLNYMASVQYVGVTSNTMVKLNGQNAFHEKLADSFNQTLSVFTRLEYKQIRFFPALLANYEFSKGLFVHGKLEQSTNMNLLMVGPSLDVNYKKMVLNLCYQFNGYERISSQALSASGRFIIGLTWNFNQKKYLINS